MKKRILIFSVLILVAFLIVGILFYALHFFRSTGVVLVGEWDKAYDYNGKLLLSSDKESALLLKTLGKTEFEEISLKSVDLSPFGFEGEKFSYYPVTVDHGRGITRTYLYTSDPSYEGFWPAMNKDRLVYIDDGGEKYCIHPKENLCYPIFSDSIEGVDVYGKDVLAFSANHSYALSLSGENVTIYHTDPMDDSLRVVDVKNVSLKDYGTSFTFGAFVGDSQAYFYTEKENVLIAIDCAEGKVARSLLPEGEYGKTLCRFYAQRLDGEKGEVLRARWNHLLLGTQFESPKLKEYENIELISVSPNGSYAAGVAEGAEKTDVLVLSEKRHFPLTPILNEGETVEKVDFIYENLIYLTLKTADGKMLSRCYRICF